MTIGRDDEVGSDMNLHLDLRGLRVVIAINF